MWSALVAGFGGMRDHGGLLRFDPRLPEGWGSLIYRLTWSGTRIRVHLTETQIEITVEDGTDTVPVEIRGTRHGVSPDSPVVVPLDGHGLRIAGLLGTTPKTGGTRADGSRITAGVPDPMPADGLVPPGLLSDPTD